MHIQLRNIHKSFGTVQANAGISLEVREGTIQGLLGENGAGKTTLAKILSGYQQMDAGQIIIDGHPAAFASPAEALAAGIGMLHQDPLDIPAFSVLDNFMLGSAAHLFLTPRQARQRLLDLSRRFGFALDPEAGASSLTVGERQQLEMVRLLALGVKVVILDEPTTGISSPQKVLLFRTLHRLASEGLSVIFVSHKLDEVEQLCSEVTVLRQGKVAGRVESPFAASMLVMLMFGQELSVTPRRDVPLGEPLLELDNAAIRTYRLSVEHLNLAVRAGEVLGLAGLEGSGQQLLMRACAGIQPLAQGKILIGGQEMTHRPYGDYLHLGARFVPAARLEEGLIPGMTIQEHFALIDESSSFFIPWRQAEAAAQAKIREYNVVGTPSTKVESLSGGNQQRALLAMLKPTLRLLILEHPTRGLDIGSSRWIWERLLERREQGTAILFTSTDLDELVEYSDRIAVFSGGVMSPPVDARQVTSESLGYLIGGQHQMKLRARLTALALAVAPIVLTLVTSVVILLIAGADPFNALAQLLSGAFESQRKFADVMVTLVPLLLAAAGMLVTFAAGLWNIGVEGQMIAGALVTTAIVRALPLPAGLLLPMTVLAGMAGGAVWGLLVGLLRTYGHVNEIFGGLGLNYIAIGLTNYLIFGPWKPADGATMSGTDSFPAAAWMPTLGNTRASLPPILLAVAAIVVVYLLLNNSRWGLRLKAIGLNPRAASRLGINTTANMLLAFAACGALAGLAGSLQTTAVYYRLIPSISAGYGYLAQLIVLLSTLRAEWVPLIVFFFSVIQVGSPRLELRLQLDSSLGGILQGSIVLFFLFMRGARQALQRRQERING